MPSPWTPSNIRALRNRTVLYLDMDEPERAVREYDDIIHLEPEDLPVRQQWQAALEPGGSGVG